VKKCLAFLLVLGMAMPIAMASDWEEDTPAPRKPPMVQTPAPVESLPPKTEETAAAKSGEGSDEPKLSGGTALLHGNATAVDVRRPPSYSAMSAQNAARAAAIQKVDDEAHWFLQQAAINVPAPPPVFKSFLESNYPQFSASAEASEPGRIVVVKGQWDDSSKPLHSFGLKYQTVKTKDLGNYPFDKCKIMIIDCAGEVPRETIQKIRDFVGYGGYLISTDWTLQNVLERAFPGFVKWNGDNTDGVITDAFAIDADSPLLKGVEGRRFTWKLDKLSQCVRVLSPDRVHIIARSSKLAHQDPQFRVLPDPVLAGVVAFEFSFGRGKVLHLVGHFDNCSNTFRPYLLPDPVPNVGISLRQVLACNFIMQALSKPAPSIPAKSGD
jgi:hypothetical protein